MKQFTVTKEVGFDAGHRVPFHASKCRNPHGHRYRLVAEVKGNLIEGGASTGMVVDFGDLKEWLMEIHDWLDHGFIVWEGDQYLRDALCNNTGEMPWKVIVVDYHPTAENLAADIFRQLAEWISDYNDHMPDNQFLTLVSVTLWETPTSSATVTA